MVDFTLYAQYYSYDSDTLTQIKATITRMNIFKEVFRDIIALGSGFNIFKLYAITHYPIMIRKFGTIDGYDTVIFKADHKYIIKE